MGRESPAGHPSRDSSAKFCPGPASAQISVLVSKSRGIFLTRELPEVSRRFSSRGFLCRALVGTKFLISCNLISASTGLLAIQGEAPEKLERQKKREFSKLLYNEGVLKPSLSWLPLPLAIITWLPVVLLPLVDVFTDFQVIGSVW